MYFLFCWRGCLSSYCGPRGTSCSGDRSFCTWSGENGLQLIYIYFFFMSYCLLISAFNRWMLTTRRRLFPSVTTPFLQHWPVLKCVLPSRKSGVSCKGSTFLVWSSLDLTRKVDNVMDCQLTRWTFWTHCSFHWWENVWATRIQLHAYLYPHFSSSLAGPA